MIRNLVCSNYRSLRNIEIPFQQITALIGPNGSGKTSILRAIDLVLGDQWPSLRSLRIPNDFTNYKISEPLKISIDFDPALPGVDRHLSKDVAVTSLRATCAQYKVKTKNASAGDLHFDFDALNAKGEQVMVAASPLRTGVKPNFIPMNVSTALRDSAHVTFIDHRRAILQHLPTNRGSVLARLFDPIRREFDKAVVDGNSARDDFRKKYEAAMDVLRIPAVVEIEKTIEETAKRMVGFMGRGAVENVRIRFGFSDPANPFQSLRIQYEEGSLHIPAEDIGLGIQSAIIVGIFETLRTRAKDSGTIIIEEPELYLHPQAQRYFYNLLVSIGAQEGCQLIYSTHSPIFADVNRFESLRLIRKEPGSDTKADYVSKADDLAFLSSKRDANRFLGSFGSMSNELCFARRVLLVEGRGDAIAVSIVTEKMGYNLDAEDYSVIECVGKSNIPFYIGICKALGIPHIVLHDEDIYSIPEAATDDRKRAIEKENEKQTSLNAEIAKMTTPGDLFVCKPSLEGMMGVGRAATEKPRRVAEALSAVSPDTLPAVLRHVISRLFADEAETAGIGVATAPSSSRPPDRNRKP